MWSIIVYAYIVYQLTKICQAQKPRIELFGVLTDYE